ncbi:MAG: PstS family phosphate ABC transporter substrate-binding protein [Bacteroidia bacterium]
MKTIHFGYLLLILSCFWACDEAPKTTQKGTGTSGTITIAVDENLQPIIEDEIRAFEHIHDNAHINARYMPGEDAIKMMINTPDSLALVITTRLLSEAERQIMLKKQRTPRPAMIAKDAIALIIHPDNPDSILNTNQMLDLLSGKANKWNQISTNNKLGDIILAFDHENSSTVRYLQDSVLKGVGISKQAFTAKSNPKVLEYVAKTPNSVGVIGVNWISDHDDKKVVSFLKNVKVVYLQHERACTNLYPEAKPNEHYQPWQAIIGGDCYPLVRRVYAIDCETDFMLGSGFVAYLSHEGQRVLHKAGLYAPYGIQRAVRIKDEM